MKVATSAPPMDIPPLASPPDQEDQTLQAAPTAPPSEFAAKKHHVSLSIIIVIYMHLSVLPLPNF